MLLQHTENDSNPTKLNVNASSTKLFMYRESFTNITYLFSTMKFCK